MPIPHEGSGRMPQKLNSSKRLGPSFAEKAMAGNAPKKSLESTASVDPSCVGTTSVWCPACVSNASVTTPACKQPTFAVSAAKAMATEKATAGETWKPLPRPLRWKGNFLHKYLYQISKDNIVAAEKTTLAMPLVLAKAMLTLLRSVGFTRRCW